VSSELDTFDLNNRIENNRLSWILHVGGMEPEHIPKRLMGRTPRGTRFVGRPNLTLEASSDRKVETLKLTIK
jgi:hypothetical protein